MTCRSRRVVELLLLALVVLTCVGGYVVAPAHNKGASALAGSAGGSTTILIRKGGLNSGYATPTVTLEHGGQLSVLNLDAYTHTVTSVATTASGAPLFDVTVPPGATRSVPAAGTLAAGRYAFYCRFHPNMRGTLTVVGGSGGTQPATQRFTLPLRVPRTVRSAHVHLDMHQARERILAHGRRTRVWTYGGTWPGPTIRRPAGHRTLVTVANHLPAGAGATTLHLHGDHHASRDDGQPATFLVRRGASRTYRYDLTDQGRPEPSSFFWYHDHRMDRTSRNNWMGLQGMFIVDDAHEATHGLPTHRRDVPLMISDRSLTRHHQLAHLHQPAMAMGHGHGMRFSGPYAPPNDANVGTRMLVDGRFAPHLDTAAVHYRLRLLNSSASSSYNLALSDGRPFVQVGTGDGLLPRPVVRQTILLGPSQRADVVVDFHGEVGQDVVLQTVARTDASTGTGSRIGPLMQFRVRRTASDHTRIPARLPSPHRIRVPRAVAKTWTFSLAGNARTGTYWAINGRAFDPRRVDHRVRLGSTEKWVLRNTSDVTHYVHIHEEQWHTVRRDGARPPPWERGLEDTWRLDPGEVVVVAARFTDYTGRFMIHCHMLDHEDHGMMAYYQVVR